MHWKKYKCKNIKHIYEINIRPKNKTYTYILRVSDQNAISQLYILF